MKNKWLLFSFSLLFASLFFAFNSNAQYSTYKEFGLMGKVKSVRLYIYDSLYNTAVNTEENFERLKIIFEYQFDSTGNIKQVLVFSTADTNKLYSTYTYEYNADARPIKNVEYRDGHLKSLVHFKWINDTSYLQCIESDNDYTESIIQLDAQYRDLSSEGIIYDRKKHPRKVIRAYGYLNHLNKNKQLTSINTYDNNEQEKQTLNVKYFETDSVGNWIQQATFYAKDGAMQRFRRRLIQYYP